MAEKMLESTRAGMTRSSFHPASIFGNDSLELFWENGQVLVKGFSSSTSQKTPSCIGYTTNPSRGREANNEDACTAKSSRPSSLHSLLDFPVQRDSSYRNSHKSSDQNSCQLDLPYSKSKNRSYLEESKLTGRAHQPATTGNGYSFTYSKQQCLPPAPFKKPRMEPIQTLATKPLIQDLGKVNFTDVLRTSVLVKSTYQENSATLPTNNYTALARVDETKATKVAKAAAAAADTSCKDPDHSVVIDSSRGSCGNTRLQGQNPVISDASKPVSFVARSQEPLPYEESEAVGHNSALSIHGSAGLRAKRKADTNFCSDPLLEYSFVRSLGASNNTDICSREQGVADDSTYLSDNDEETGDVKEKHAREGTRVKRSRNAETHNLYERKRRDKINKKIRVLKELIPNCNKVDKASMLDDAIEYLQTLNLQLQILSMGTGLCLPLMMLPTTPHHMINTPHLPQLMGAGLGFRPGTGIPCNLPQFPIPPLPGITDNRVRMFGFPSQMLPMPMSHAPFTPMVGNPSTQPLQATCSATNLPENLASAHSNGEGLSAPNNSL